LTLRHVKAELAGRGDGLGGKCLVGLDEIHVGYFQAGLSHGVSGRGDGARAHNLRVNAALAPGNELHQRLEVVFFDGFALCEENRRGAVVDAGGVSGRHAAVLFKGGCQLGKGFR
jgi:hypothetical protein